MKELLKLGTVLSKEEQKQLNGGFGNAPIGICLKSRCQLRCDQVCSDGTAPICF